MKILNKIFKPDILDILPIIDKIREYNSDIGDDLHYLVMTYRTFRAQYHYDEWVQEKVSVLIKEGAISKMEYRMLLNYLKNIRKL